MPLGIYTSTAIINDGTVLKPAPGASVTVRKESDGTLASIFSDRAGGTPLANPFTADSNGRFEFYAAGLDEGYQVTVQKGSDTYTLNNQQVGTVQERDHGTDDIEIPLNSDLRYGFALDMLYEPETDLEFYDGYVHGQPFTLIAVSIYARTAPDNDLTIEVLKNGTGTGTTATLSGAANHEKTTFGTPVDFSASDRMGFKVSAVGSGEPGNDYKITPHFYGGI